MLQGYVRGIPRDVEEAARGRRRDAGSRSSTGIVAPLIAPGRRRHDAVRLHHGVERVLLRPRHPPDLRPLHAALKLKQFVGIEGIVRLGPLAAAALLATIPSLVLFTVIQRWLTRGLLSGAVKG